MKTLIEIEFDSIDTILYYSENLAELMINIIDPKDADSVGMKTDGKRTLQFYKMDRVVGICMELLESHMPPELCTSSHDIELFKELAELLSLNCDEGRSS